MLMNKKDELKTRLLANSMGNKIWLDHEGNTLVAAMEKHNVIRCLYSREGTAGLDI